LEGLRGTNDLADSVSSAFIVEDLLRDQQLPLGVDRPHPMSVPFIQATEFDNSALLRVNRNIVPGYCHCRHSSANGCSAATGRRAFVGAPAAPGEWRRLLGAEFRRAGRSLTE